MHYLLEEIEISAGVRAKEKLKFDFIKPNAILLFYW
jgi:hypothetical protein